MKSLTTMLSNFFNSFKKETRFKTFLFVIILISFTGYMYCVYSLSSYYPGNLITMLVCGLMILAICVYVIIYGLFRIDIFLVSLIIINLLIIISNIINFTPEKIDKRFPLITLCAFFIYSFARQDKTTPKSLLYAFYFSLICFAITYIFEYKENLLNWGSGFKRLGTEFDNQNGIARPFVFGFLISLFYALKRKYIFILPCFVFFYLCLTTGSISNLLSLFVCSIAGSYICITKKKALITTIVVIGIIGIGIAILQIPAFSYFNNRLIAMINSFLGIGTSVQDIDSSFEGRLQLAMLGFRFFLNNPIFGNGTGYVVTSTFGAGSYAHNNISEMLADYGIISFIIFELLLLIPITKKSNTFDKRLVFYICSYLLFFQLFLVTFYLKTDLVIVAIMLATINLKTPSIDIGFRNKRIVFLINRKIKV